MITEVCQQNCRETSVIMKGGGSGGPEGGSLRGKLVIADDWDSDEVNEAIAGDFGLAP